MKFEMEELSATKRKIKVEIPYEDVAVALDKAYVELNRDVKIDGFRPGKAPRSFLEKKYSKSVDAEVVERLVPRAYFEAVRESGIIPVEEPTFEEKELAITKGQPLVFTAVMEVRPAFELAEYKGVEVKEEKLEVTPEELSEAIEEIRDVHSTLETVEEDRPSANDDYVVIDFEGFVDGAALPGGKAENYPLQLGSASFIPGFEEQLVGLKKGELKEINVKFPESYKNADLAGKDAMFKIALKELKKKVQPALDDDLAKDSGLGQTVAELEERIKKDILSYKERAFIARQKDMILKELVKRNEFELPANMVEKEVRALIMRRHQEIMQSGMTPSAAGFDMKAFEAEMRPVAEERVKSTIIMAAIADKEDIKVTDSEMEAGVRRLSAEVGYPPEKIKEMYEKKDGSLEGLRGIVGEDKVLAFLLSHAKKTA